MLLDLAQLVRSCAPNVGVTTMLAIISAESGGKVFSIGDNTTRTSLEFKSQHEAIQNAKELIEKDPVWNMSRLCVEKKLRSELAAPDNS